MSWLVDVVYLCVRIQMLLNLQFFGESELC